MKRLVLIFSFFNLMWAPVTASAQDSTKTVKNQMKTVAEQLKTIKGQVVDAATGLPMPGVIVSAYGNSRYTAMTDERGNYALKVPTYVTSVTMRVDGFCLQQRAVTDSVANGAMYRDLFSATYKTTTVATQSAMANAFDNTSEVSIDPLIHQQLGADVRSVSRGGMIGLGNQMLVAGINSLHANAQPLVVIDDVVMDMQYNRELLHDGYFNNLLANLNVNDIESVTVLKNGTALYGAKGANGVVLIKTKRNKSMATKIDVTINGRFELTPRLPKMMDAEDYRLYASELLANKTASVGKMKFMSIDPDYYYYNQYHNETDWSDEVYHNAFSQNYGINVQGGDNVASYNLSVGYSLANSTLKEHDYSRFNMRMNSDINVFRGFDVRFDASYSDVDRGVRDDGAPADATSLITSPGFLGLAKAPFLSPYAYDKYGHLSHYVADADDYLEGMFMDRGRLPNPVGILEQGSGKNRNSLGTRLVTFSIMPKYTFNKHLSVSEQFTLALFNVNENYYLPLLGVPEFTVPGLDESSKLQNMAQSMASRQTIIQSDTRVTWNNRYGAHSVNVMGGVRFQSNEYNLTSQRGYNTGNDKTPNMSNSLQFKDTGGADDKTREITWYALGDYNYAERYYVSAGLSAQSSSRFGDDADGLKLGGVVWGVFPSIEGAWVLTNEPWMPKLPYVDYLRVSAGFDMTGNDDIDYKASRTYFVANRMFENTLTGKSLGNIGNTKLQWETTNRLTAGLEGNFINNRVNLRFNFFKSWTSNLLALRQLAWTSGQKENWSNGGKLENTGFDVSVGVKALAMKDFSLEVGASAGHYKNKVTALPDGDRSFVTEYYGAGIQTAVGQPIGMFYGWKTNGVYATEQEAAADGLYLLKTNGDKANFRAGDMRFIDQDGNGRIDENDRTVIGDPNPDLYGNIYAKAQWKQFTLSAVFNYSLGNDLYNYQRSLLEGGNLFINQTSAMSNRWTTEGQQTSIPRIEYQDPMGNSRFSDRWIEDGSYLRLANVTLSYHLPIQSTYLQGITFWGSAANLFTITRYLGSDPDCSMVGGALSMGIDRGVVAAGRSFSVGMNINL